jgi:threonine/homoserine/homoserine lactone efflux protein
MAPSYFHEFITLAAVHFLAVIAPGADFAMVVRQSLVYGRRTAVLAALGIGLGMLLHFAYTIIGVGLVISRSAILYTVIKVLGAGYLFYIGYRSLRARKAPAAAVTGGAVPAEGSSAEAAELPAGMVSGGSVGAPSAGPSTGAAVRAGFLVNALNPKATLFFLSIFTAIVSPGTPVSYQMGYCAWIFAVQVAWFSLVALVFSHPAVRTRFSRLGLWIERLMGVVLIALGIRLLLSARA